MACEDGAREVHAETEALNAAYVRVTERMAQAPEAYFGAQTRPVFSIVRVIRRPFSDLIQCRAHFGHKSLGLYVKFARVDRNTAGERERILKETKREVAVGRTLFRFFSAEKAVSVPEVLAFFPDEIAVVTKEKKGLPLMSRIIQCAKGFPGAKKTGRLKQDCYSLGSALRIFQRVPPLDVGVEEHPSKLISYVDLRLKLLSEPGHLNAADRRAVLGYLERRLQEVGGQAPDFCSVHGDLSLGNILMAPEGVVFLDLGGYRQGAAAFDPAYFSQHLDAFLSDPRFFSRTIAHLKEAFFEGYQVDGMQESPLFRAYYIRNMVNHLLDLSRTEGLSLLKKGYQHWQYRQVLASLKNILRKT